MTPEESFEEKVLRMKEGCWVWTACLTSAGYGQLWDGEEVVYTHRWAYERYVGPIPAGLQIDHLCRNRACCNPEHLEAVTQAVNMNRIPKPTECRVCGSSFPESHRRGRTDCAVCHRNREYGRKSHHYSSD